MSIIRSRLIKPKTCSKRVEHMIWGQFSKIVFTYSSQNLLVKLSIKLYWPLSIIYLFNIKHIVITIYKKKKKIIKLICAKHITDFVFLSISTDRLIRFEFYNERVYLKLQIVWIHFEKFQTHKRYFAFRFYLKNSCPRNFSSRYLI